MNLSVFTLVLFFTTVLAHASAPAADEERQVIVHPSRSLNPAKGHTSCIIRPHPVRSEWYSFYENRLKSGILDTGEMLEVTFSNYISALDYGVVLDSYNRHQTTYVRNFKPAIDPNDTLPPLSGLNNTYPTVSDNFGVFLRDSDGFVLGGLNGCFREFRSPHAWILYLSVTENMRGKGYARLIMSEAEKYIKGRKIYRAALETNKYQAPELYRKLGYDKYYSYISDSVDLKGDNVVNQEYYKVLI